MKQQESLFATEPLQPVPPKPKKVKKSILDKKKRAFECCQPKILFQPETTGYYIVVPSELTPSQVNALRVKCVKHGEDEPTIISLFSPAPKTAGKNFVKDCYRADLDLSTLIPANSRVITMGDMTLQALTLSQDLSVDGFSDYILNRTCFYHPKLVSWVFPAGGWHDIVFNNEWEYAFFEIQKAFVFNTKLPAKPRQAFQFRELMDMTEVAAVFRENENNPQIAIDLETSGLDFTIDYIGCVTFSFDGKVGFYVDWKSIDPAVFGSLISSKKQVYANGKFDCKFMLKAGVPRECLHIDGDVVQLSHVLNELSSNSLKTAAWMYSFHGGYDLDLKKQLHVTGDISYLGADSAILKEYATKDAILTLVIHENMLTEMKRQNALIGFAGEKKMDDYYFQYMLPAVNMFIDLEYDGMYINRDALKELSIRTHASLVEAKKEALRLLDLPEDTMVNIDSGSQLGKWLEEKGYPCIERSKSGWYKTNKAVLNEWQKISAYAETIDALFEYKKLKALYNTFIGSEEENTGFWQHLKQAEGGKWKVHPHFAAMLANSGRNRCSAPNLTNQVKHGNLAEAYRAIFSVDSDYYISEWDAAGLQLRIAGILSDDPGLRAAFLDKAIKGDIHSMTAQNIFMREVSLEDFMKHKGEAPYNNYRYMAKACFPEGTRIKCEKGDFKIEDVVPPVNEGWHTPYLGNTKVFNRNGKLQEVESTYYGSSDTLIEFELENGESLQVTPDHIMKVVRDGVEVSIEARHVVDHDELVSC